MDRRNSLEITAKILQIAEKGALRSHIAFEAKLNYKCLKNYLDVLEKRGLITSDGNPGNKVRTTQKGRLFAQQYRNLLQLLGQEQDK